MADISHSLALEIADNWEQMAETETQAPPGRRATLRECADLLRMMASPPAPEPVDPAIEWTRKILAAAHAGECLWWEDVARVQKGYDDAAAVLREALAAAERPVIDVPEEVLKAAERVKADSYFRTAEFTVADFILSRANGAGIRAKGPPQ